MRTDLAAVIPAFRCAGTIGAVVEEARRHVPVVYVVDDGSGDATAEEARRAGARVESLHANRGKGYALRRGIVLALAARPAAVAFLDGDGQHDPRALPALVRAWEEGMGDLVIGARLMDPGRIPGPRYWTNYIGSRILSWMAGVELADSQSGYRLLDAELLRRLPLRSDGYAIESEMLLKAVKRGARIAHVPVEAIYNGAGSHFRPIRDTLRIACEAIYFQVFDDGGAPPPERRR
jgi:glycosyltransferase involved in cell wall biosynthesis